jgi:nucleoside-diphosphate-sugar epimerase
MKSFYQSKPVLVTGADGFIGSRLVARLIELGAVVYGATHGKDGDLSDTNNVTRLFQENKPSVVFNVASEINTEKSLEHAEDTIQHTYGIARTVIDGAVQAGVERFVQFGSIDEYGSCEAPFVETMREEPYSPYSLGKIMATQYALMTARLTPMKVCVVRPAATYGPAQGFKMLIPNVIKSGIEKKDFDMNPGEQLRDFIYVDDVVEGALLAGMHESSGEIFNLGSNRGVIVKDVVEEVNKAMGNPIKINFGAQPYRQLDSRVFYMNSKKAKKLLGWEPKTDLADGIAKTVAWYRKQ